MMNLTVPQVNLVSTCICLCCFKYIRKQFIPTWQMKTACIKTCIIACMVYIFIVKSFWVGNINNLEVYLSLQQLIPLASHITKLCEMNLPEPEIHLRAKSVHEMAESQLICPIQRGNLKKREKRSYIKFVPVITL